MASLKGKEFDTDKTMKVLRKGVFRVTTGSRERTAQERPESRFVQDRIVRRGFVDRAKLSSQSPVETDGVCVSGRGSVLEVGQVSGVHEMIVAVCEWPAWSSWRETPQHVEDQAIGECL